MRSMSRRRSSGSSETTRPRRLTCRYHWSASSTVRDARGSLSMYWMRLRVWSMLTSTRPPSHRYQVATVCGERSGLSVPITAGFGFASSASSSGGSVRTLPGHLVVVLDLERARERHDHREPLVRAHRRMDVPGREAEV